MNAIEFWSLLDRTGFQVMRILVSLLWQSSILFLVVGLLVCALRKRQASLRHVLWVTALLVGPAVPLLGWAAAKLGTPQAAIPVMPTYSAPVVQPVQPIVPPAAERTETFSEAAPLSPSVTHTATQEEPFSLAGYPWAIMLFAYVAGTITVVSLIILGRLRLWYWVRKGCVVTDTGVLDSFHRAQKQLGMSKDFLVVKSKPVHVPMTVGSLHPIILLPSGFTEALSGSELQQVALHELAHIKRHDPLLLSLASILRAFLFFHPLVWWACRQVSLLAEEAADDAVLEATGEEISYAAMLTRLAQNLPRRTLATELAVGIVLSRSAFLRRVEAILSHRRHQIRRLSRLALIATVLGAVISLALAAALPLGEKARSPEEQTDSPGARPVFDSALPLKVYERGHKPLGQTPTTNGKGIVIPEGAMWLVRPLDEHLSDDDLALLANEAREKSIPGLELGGFDDITDAGLAHLAGLSGLKILHLNGCRQITSTGLAHLKGLTGLEELHLWGCTGVTDEGLSHLAGLTGLKVLDLRGCSSITDAGLAHLQEMKRLERLYLWHCERITHRGLTHLQGLSQMKTLELNSCKKITDAGLAHLSSLTDLRTLSLSRCVKITDAGLAQLKELVKLEELYLSGTQVTDAGLAHLGKMKALQRLELRDCKGVRDAGLVHLVALPNLKRLNLWNTGITDAGAVHLKELTKLETLYLWDCKITDAALVHLKGLSELRELSLSGTRITDAGLAHLSGLRLHKLYLARTAITSAGLAHLKSLRKVKWLDLTMCEQIDDAGLIHLQKLPNLKVLNLSHTYVTASGLKELRALSGLEQLYLWECSEITEENLKALRAALPATRVMWHQASWKSTRKVPTPPPTVKDVQQARIYELLEQVAWKGDYARAATQELISIGEPAVRILTGIALDPKQDGALRQKMLALVGRFPGDQGRIALETIFLKSNYHREAARLLAGRKEEASVPVLLQALDRPGRIRIAAIEALVALDVKSAAPSIVPCLTDSEWSVRHHAVEALSEFGAKEYAPQMRKLLDDEDKSVSLAAMEALAKLGDEPSLPLIEARLESGERYVMRTAVRALSHYQNRAVPALERFIKKNLKEANLVVGALRRCQGTERVCKLLVTMATNPLTPERGRESARQLLAYHSWEKAPGWEAARDDCRKLLRSRDLEVCSLAAEALAAIGDSDSIPEVEKLLGKLEAQAQATPEDVERARSALAALKSPVPRAPLVEARDEEIRLKFTPADIDSATTQNGGDKHANFVHHIEPARFDGLVRAIDGAKQAFPPPPDVPLMWGGWAVASDPLINVYLKDGRKLVIMFSSTSKVYIISKAVAGRPLYFESPALIELIEQTTIAGLRKALAGEEWSEKRFQATVELFDRGDNSGRKVLLESLKVDKSIDTRLEAAYRLAKEKNPQAFATLAELSTVASTGHQGYVLIKGLREYNADKAVPVLKKIGLEGKFPGHGSAAVHALSRIATHEAIQTMITDLWGRGENFKMYLLYAAGGVFENGEKQKCLEWWQKNKHRSRMELLADAVEADPQGYGGYCVPEMRKLDANGAVRELMQRLEQARGESIAHITSALSTLTGVDLGTDKEAWQRWWQDGHGLLEDPLWGEAVEGVQCRLRADKLVWEAGEVPTFKADVRNRGSHALQVVWDMSICEVEMDGRWYFPPAIDNTSVFVPLVPGGEQQISIMLGPPHLVMPVWVVKDLEQKPGKHTVRVAVKVAHGGEIYRPPVLVISNPVEIEILPPSSAEGWAKLEELVAALKDEDPLVREKAAKTLIEMHDVKAVGPLVDFLKHDSRPMRQTAARILDEMAWKPTTRGEKVLYLIGREKWDEALAAGPLAKQQFRPHRANGVVGALERDIPILLPLDVCLVQKGAVLDRGDAQRPIIFAYPWLEFAEAEGTLTAAVHMQYDSWPHTRWDLQLEILNAGGEVISHSARRHENSGAIKRYPHLEETTLQFELGNLSELADAKRFRFSLESIRTVQGGPFQFGEKVPLSLDLGALERSKVLRAQWMKLQKANGEVRATVHVRIISSPKCTWRLTLELWNTEGQMVGRGSSDFENSGIVLGVPALSERDIELTVKGNWDALQEAKRYKFILERLGPTSTEGPFKLGRRILVKAVAGTREHPKVIETEWIELEKKDRQILARLRVKWLGVVQAKWLATVGLLDGQGDLLSHAEAVFATSKVVRGYPLWAARTLDFALGRWEDVAKATRFRVTIERAAEPAWGKAVEGLRCRWVKPSKPVIAGTAPVITVEVENASGDAVYWQCWEGTWGIQVEGVSWRRLGGWRLGSLKVKTGPGIRTATAKEVGEIFGIGRAFDPSRAGTKPTDPMPGYYVINPGSRLTLSREFSWKPDEPGKYEIQCQLFRRFSYSGYPPTMTCPPLVLEVIPKPKPETKRTEPSTAPANARDLEVELKRGRLVQGRVVDHTGQPVEGAQVFLANYHGVKVIDGQAEPFAGATTVTDKEGHFVLDGPDQGAALLVVSTPFLHLWEVRVPEAGPDITIKLPEPATLLVRYDIEGDNDPGCFFLRLSTREMKGWKNVVSEQSFTAPNKGEAVLKNVTPGVYLLDRRKRVDTWGGTPACDRTAVRLEAGKTTEVEFVRRTGHPITGEVTGLSEAEFDEGVIFVKGPEATPDLRDSSSPFFDALTWDAAGRFKTARLLPGSYKVIAWAFKPWRPGGVRGTGGPVPDFAGIAKVTVPKDGEPPHVRIEMNPRSGPLPARAERALPPSSAEGAFELGKRIPVKVIAGTPEHPKMIETEWLEFEKTGTLALAKLRLIFAELALAEWKVMVELLGEQRATLARAQATSASTGRGKTLELSLGRWEGVSRATRFRVSIERIIEQRLAASRAWYILRQTDVRTLLLGLPQRLTRVMKDFELKGVEHGTASVELDIKIEGDVEGEIAVGFFNDPKWSKDPEQVFWFPGPGRHKVRGLPPGKVYIGAMIGLLPEVKALGVDQFWPAPVLLEAGKTTKVQILVSPEFKDAWRTHSPGTDEAFAREWKNMDPTRMITVRTMDARGNPVPFCRVTFVDRGESVRFHNSGTDHKGYAYCDEIAGPFSLMVQHYDWLPQTLAHRYQYREMAQLYNAKDRPTVTLRGEPFPKGTGKVVGQVKNTYGRPLKEYYIRVTHRKEKKVEGRVESSSIAYQLPVIDRRGCFEIHDLPPGTYRLDVRAFDFPTHVHHFNMGEFTIPEKEGAVVEANVKVTAKELRYGRALYEDGSPVYPGSYIGWFERYDQAKIKEYHGTPGRYCSWGTEPDGSFRVCLSRKERKQLMDTSQGMVEIKDESGNKIGEVHIDKLSRDKDKPYIVTFPRAKKEGPEAVK